MKRRFQAAFNAKIKQIGSLKRESRMKKKKISTHYLEQFLSWLMEAMHPDLAQFEGLNLANRASVRQLVNSYLKPRFDELSPGEQFRVKESLRYGMVM